MIKTIYEHGGGVYNGRGIYAGGGIYPSGELPRQGDVLYVPSACAYTPNPDGSVPEGTPTGKAKIVPLEKVDDAAMIAAGYASVGLVAAVFGRKVYIVWKNVDTTCKWCADATSSSYSIPSTVNVDALIQSTMEDNADRKGFRQGVSWEVLRAKLSGEGLPSGQSAWTGGNPSDGAGSYFYTLLEWTTTNQGTKHPSASELTTYGTGVDGWELYLRSRLIKYPSSFNAPIYKDGQDETKILADINSSKGRAFFPIANFATTHYTTYGSFGTGKNFWNVPGLRYGDWFMAGAHVQCELFKDVSCSNSSVLKSTDRVNIAMSKISNTRISLYEKNYWLPVLRSRGSAWRLGSSGYFYNYDSALLNGYMVLSCALLNY